MIDFETEYRAKGLKVAGIDEAGRGALAGPVFAAAVILNDNALIEDGVDDSKVLSPKKRESLFETIKRESVCYSSFLIDNEQIDELNILKATHLAMSSAVQELNPKPGYLLIDGNSYGQSDINFRTIVDGDSKCLSIAAASIVAKVSRDIWMTNYAHSEFPLYGFDRNKGYGTAEHLEALKKYGPCKYHRKTFLKKFYLKQIEQSIF